MGNEDLKLEAKPTDIWPVWLIFLALFVWAGVAACTEDAPETMPKLKTHAVQCQCTYDWEVCICSGRRYMLWVPKVEREQPQ